MNDGALTFCLGKVGNTDALYYRRLVVLSIYYFHVICTDGSLCYFPASVINVYIRHSATAWAGPVMHICTNKTRSAFEASYPCSIIVVLGSVFSCMTISPGDYLMFEDVLLFCLVSTSPLHFPLPPILRSSLIWRSFADVPKPVCI